MSNKVHNIAARKQKHDASFKQLADAIPEVAEGEVSDVQAIVIIGPPEMDLNDQLASENATLVELGEASHTPTAIQVIHPPEQASGRPERPQYTQVQCSKPRLPDRLLLNSYLPPRDSNPPMEEVLDPGPEGAQEIIER